MGCENREFLDYEASSFSFSESLLFATMCIIGLPVDVHVKDGSVYSGIFYTASVEMDYGIVLKKARMTKRGKSSTNIGNGELIDTLVIQSGDLVQVVAKGVLLPADGVAGNLASDNAEAVMFTVQPDKYPVNHAKESIQPAMDIKETYKVRSSLHNGNCISHTSVETNAKKEHECRKFPFNDVSRIINSEQWRKDQMTEVEIDAPAILVGRRQTDHDCSQGEYSDFKQKQECQREKAADKVQGSCSSLNTSCPLMKPVEERHTRMASKLLPNGLSCDPACVSVKSENHCCTRSTLVDTSSSAVTSSVSTLSNPVMVLESLHTSIGTSTEMVPRATENNRSAKEFRLNPGAKIFSPSYTNTLSVNSPTVRTVASMGYVPNNSPLVSVGAAQPGNGLGPFSPHSSVPVKVIQYGNGNLTSGNGVTGTHSLQPVVGQVGIRPQARAASQYPIQAGPVHAHQNSQAVMIGRFGQVLHVHPYSQELVPGATAMVSPLATRPLLTPQQAQLQKHQASAAGQALQLCMPSPVMSSGQQPFAMQCHMPLTHFPYSRPIPGCNGLFNSKFA